jgi:hypothetical protein
MFAEGLVELNRRSVFEQLSEAVDVVSTDHRRATRAGRRTSRGTRKEAFSQVGILCRTQAREMTFPEGAIVCTKHVCSCLGPANGQVSREPVETAARRAREERAPQAY